MSFVEVRVLLINAKKLMIPSVEATPGRSANLTSRDITKGIPSILSFINVRFPSSPTWPKVGVGGNKNTTQEPERN